MTANAAHGNGRDIRLPAEATAEGCVFYLWRDVVFGRESTLKVPIEYIVYYVSNRVCLIRADIGQAKPYNELAKVLQPDRSGKVWADLAVVCTAKMQVPNGWANGNQACYVEPATGAHRRIAMSGSYTVNAEYSRHFAQFCLNKNWPSAKLKTVLDTVENAFKGTIQSATQKYIAEKKYGEHAIEMHLRDIAAEVMNQLNIHVFADIGMCVCGFDITNHHHVTEAANELVR